MLNVEMEEVRKKNFKMMITWKNSRINVMVKVNAKLTCVSQERGNQELKTFVLLPGLQNMNISKFVLK